jgi:hypothetical protein
MNGSPVNRIAMASSSRQTSTPQTPAGRQRNPVNPRPAVTTSGIIRRPGHRRHSHDGPARPPCSVPRRWGRDDRGSATAFGLFLIVVGAMIEGGNPTSARGHATDIAQQAARAGADKLDPTASREHGPVRIDPAAASAFLAQAGETGTLTATPAQVTVTVTVTRPGILAPILGINTLTVRAIATTAPTTG